MDGWPSGSRYLCHVSSVQRRCSNLELQDVTSKYHQDPHHFLLTLHKPKHELFCPGRSEISENAPKSQFFTLRIQLQNGTRCRSVNFCRQNISKYLRKRCPLMSGLWVFENILKIRDDVNWKDVFSSQL